MAGLVAQAWLLFPVGVVAPVLVHPVAVPRLHAAITTLLRGIPAVQAPDARLPAIGNGIPTFYVAVALRSSAIRLEPFVIPA